MIENTAFYQSMPENSDSVGRAVVYARMGKSCRAYQNSL